MLRLKYADYEGNYCGFTLKKGYWYGIKTETNQPIATSGWEAHGSVSIYTLINGKWKPDWYPIEDTDFQVSNIPEVNTEGKLTFPVWLEDVQGIAWNDWDENYFGQIAKQIEEEYDSYYYDGLPQFVQKNM